MDRSHTTNIGGLNREKKLQEKRHVDKPMNGQMREAGNKKTERNQIDERRNKQKRGEASRQEKKTQTRGEASRQEGECKQTRGEKNMNQF